MARDFSPKKSVELKKFFFSAEKDMQSTADTFNQCYLIIKAVKIAPAPAETSISAKTIRRLFTV